MSTLFSKIGCDLSNTQYAEHWHVGCLVVLVFHLDYLTCILLEVSGKKRNFAGMEDFIHLHVHTYYSILDGQSKIKNLVDKAIGNGMKGLAVTDHGDMFGIKEFHDYCIGVNKKRKEKGEAPFKPIFGCEMYVARNCAKEVHEGKENMGGYHLIVLAKNYQGYKNLIKLVSNSWVDGYYMRPRTDRADLERYHEGLIVCSACIAGEVPAKILKGDMAGAREAVEWYHNLFGDDYYLELQRHEVKNPTQRANRETFPLQQQANKVLIELAHEYGIKLICTNDVHFVDEENAEARTWTTLRVCSIPNRSGSRPVRR